MSPRNEPVERAKSGNAAKVRKHGRRGVLMSVGTALAVVGVVAGGLWIGSRDSAPVPEASPSVAAWPPTRVVEAGVGTSFEGRTDRGYSLTLPALQAAYLICNLMEYKHEYWVYADMELDDTMEHITIEQRSKAWVEEEYFHHPIDEGELLSAYPREWIAEYLGHPLPDGYFLWTAQACIMDYLDAPPSILDDMLATRTEDGVQTATWDTFRATWTNDGDAGPDVDFTYERPGTAD
jgi:hypothetical protein